MLICTPPSTHRDIALHFLQNHVAVLCEKPVATKLEDAVDMVETARLNDTIFTMASKFRYVDDVIRAIKSEHAELPGGRLEVDRGRAELGFKTLGEVGRVEEFGDLVVAVREGGPILLRDVARVEDGLEDERSYAEIDGQPGVSLLVRRQSGRNSVEVARLVKAEIAKLEEMAPAGVRLVAARDVSRFIESAIRDVTFDMTLGACLAVLVTLLFLRSLRSTVIAAIAIPISIIGSVALVSYAGFTMNKMTLLAPAPAVLPGHVRAFGDQHRR